MVLVHSTDVEFLARGARGAPGCAPSCYYVEFLARGARTHIYYVEFLTRGPLDVVLVRATSVKFLARGARSVHFCYEWN